jgi:MoaA/NifB/PqqE/SkfB family radical SAM enzyme
MCNIWKHKTTDLPIERFVKIASNPLFYKIRNLTFTGGEPTLRDDLHLLLESILQSSPFLNCVSLTTNALLPERLVEIIRRFLFLQESYRPDLKILIQISLDGPKKLHDQSRGVPGAFEKVQESVKNLETLKKNSKAIDYYYLCVLQPINLGEIDAIESFFDELPVKTVFNPLCDASYILPENNPNLILTASNVKVLMKFYESKLTQKIDPLLKYHYSEVLHWFRTGVRTKPCALTYQHILINDDGAILPCLNHGNQKFENLLSVDLLQGYWRSPERMQLVKNLRREVCPGCRAFCGPNSFDAITALLRMGLIKRWNQFFS